jgi:hypothetical protein
MLVITITMENFSITWLKTAILRIKNLNGDDSNINSFDVENASKEELYVFYDAHVFDHVHAMDNKKLALISKQNPHVRQNKMTGFTHEFSRTLENTMPRLEYYRRKDKFKSVLHWGQRKLLLVEIEFLTKFAQDGDLVVYAGAAPGNHILFLATLFPTLGFALYDPNDFAIKPQGKIQIFQQYFTDKIAALFAMRKDVLFISDVRTASPSSMDAEKIELRVEIDNAMQKSWYEIMRPKKAMFKFRLPWLVPYEANLEYNSSDPNSKELIVCPHNSKTKKKIYKWVTTGGQKFEYLAGDVYIQPWAPQTSTETRLVLGPLGDDEKEPPMVTYDNTEYEERMFYYNNHMRPSLFKQNVCGEGLDHCYDCATESHIMEEYLARVSDLKPDTNSMHKQISNMSKDVSQILGGRRLNQPQPPPGHRTFRPTKLIEQGYVPGHKNKKEKKSGKRGKPKSNQGA